MKERIGRFRDILLPHETVDAFCVTFPGKWGVLWAIILRVSDDLKLRGLVSVSHLVQVTGKKRWQIVNCLQSLEAMNVISIQREKGRVNVVTFNPDPSKWVVCRKSRYDESRLQKMREQYRQMTKDAIDFKGVQGK